MSGPLSPLLCHEWIERDAAEFLGGDLGVARRRSQVDVWDARKDISRAALGAIVALARDFHSVWPEGLRVSHPPSLGRIATVRLLGAKEA
jgi:hypothetical protein